MNNSKEFDSHKNALSLKKLVLASVVQRLAGPFVNEKVKSLPPKIGNYKLKSKIKKTGQYKPFLLGVYENPKGEKVFAKYWSGKVKNFSYFTLMNESIVSQVVGNTVKRIGNTMPKKFRNITFPKHIKIIERKNSLMVLFEFVDFSKKTRLTNSDKRNVYFKLLDFVEYIGIRLTKNERKLISERRLFDNILLYPILLLVAIIKNPKATRSLVNGIVILARSVPAFIKNSHLSLVHRDLHFENILVSKNRIVLTDLEVCLFSDLMYESVNTARYHWEDKSFRTGLISEMKNRFGKTKDYEKIVNGLFVLSATHGLTDRYDQKKSFDNYLDVLNFATK